MCLFLIPCVRYSLSELIFMTFQPLEEQGMFARIAPFVVAVRTNPYLEKPAITPRYNVFLRHASVLSTVFTVLVHTRVTVFILYS